MPEHHDKTLSGQVTHLFGHRFVVRTEAGDVLADLTPEGLEQITLQIGDEVTLHGEMKPSELKVARLTRSGKTIQLEHAKKHNGDHHPSADPSVALAAARAAGFHPVGEPRRKPKHFEVLGRKKGDLQELHIELDGHVRKSKPVSKDDPKWAAELGL